MEWVVIMSEDSKKGLEVIPVSEVFNNVCYEVPIYQRNYAWGEDQINQLLDDIDTEINFKDKTYFLGNLIVNQNNNGVYEVIDGQQRLTTLFLLQCYLFHENPSKGSLTFETREKSNRILNLIATNKLDEDDDENNSLATGYKIIEKYFSSQKNKEPEFINKLKQVQLIRIQVPQKIDLNHYFEVMNTRGEQLELHEIVKARLLSMIDDLNDREIAADIWEKCSKLDNYLQMNFELQKRKLIFDKDWNNLNNKITDFDKLREVYQVNQEIPKSNTLLEIMSNKKKINEDKHEETDNDRFESIISFPNFLLQVEAATNLSHSDEASLNDNNLIEKLKGNWKNEAAAKKFIFNLLKCRIIFDRLILKREFTADFKEAGKWSLQKLKLYDNKANYINTFSDEISNRQILMLEEALRITYTSPKTMDWISEVLRYELSDKTKLLSVLENYARKKVKDSEFKEKSGFGIERIVFTYLDYLLFRDGYTYAEKEIIKERPTDWDFQFRSSIEHFYPQHPAENDKLEDDVLNSFGNLALITVSGNSTFNNDVPIGKLKSHPSIIKQSLKLKIMAKMTESANDWTPEMIEAHRKEMFEIIDDDLKNN